MHTNNNLQFYIDLKMLGLYGLRSLDSGSVIGLISAQHAESGLSDAAGIAISVE